MKPPAQPTSDAINRQSVVLSVIAPCLNEESNIDVLADRTLATFDELGIEAELVLVDDGSTDDTWRHMTARTQLDERISCVRHEVNRGMEAAWRSGAAAARGQLICLIDADLQNRPEDLIKLYKQYLRELPDLVQAVRHPVAGVTRCRFFSRGLNWLLNFVFGTKLRDNKSGFILCRRDVFHGILRHRKEYKYFQSFIGVSAVLRGYSIAEVDTDFDPRHGGTSFLSRLPIGVSLRTFWELLRFRAELREEGLLRKQPKTASWPISSALADLGGSEL